MLSTIQNQKQVQEYVVLPFWGRCPRNRPGIRQEIILQQGFCKRITANHPFFSMESRRHLMIDHLRGGNSQGYDLW